MLVAAKRAEEGSGSVGTEGRSGLSKPRGEGGCGTGAEAARDAACEAANVAAARAEAAARGDAWAAAATAAARRGVLGLEKARAAALA